MKKVNVLLTCIGGRYSVNTMLALQESKDPKIEIIGVDANPDVTSQKFVKKFYPVPDGSDRKKYVEELFNICEKEKIDIVIPCSDEEALAISRAKGKFTNRGTICAVDDIDKLLLSKFQISDEGIDKFELFNRLSELGVPMPKYRLVKSAEEVRDFARDIGYYENERKFILKPTTGRGARNVHIIGEDGNEENPLENVCQTLGVGKSVYGIGKFSYLAMEYLPGDAYDVDVLAENGNPIVIVPRKRLWKNRLSPYSEGCMAENNKKLIEFVRNIVEKLKLHCVYDFDCGTTADGNPAIYEINPRFSGAVAADLCLGVNIPVMLVRMLKGMGKPKFEIKYDTPVFPATIFYKFENGKLLCR